MTVLLVVTHDGAPTAEHVARAVPDRADLTTLPDRRLGDVIDDRGLDLVVVASGDDTDAGHRAARTVRAATTVPLCLVTPSRREADELLAFARGCDDYVTTRVSPEVLRARLGGLIARGRRWTAGDGTRFACLTLDPMLRTATLHDETLSLTRTEFDLLHALVTEQRRVVSRWELLERGWRGLAPNDHVLDVHLSRLRRKVLHAGGPRLADPVPGVGYRIGSAACTSPTCGARLRSVASVSQPADRAAAPRGEAARGRRVTA
ncbi:winged-helix domain-containing protein [Oryzobacter sp. R7]|uniref:winged helix-turn-helix transcriptional regulator n=1 Tax=Oryzobacter faecalis TaxID=3388656 RepID=UPI00398D4B6B